MYSVKLKQIESNHTNLRSTTVVGWTPSLPKEGERFFMYAQPLDKRADFRHVYTTPLRKVRSIHSDKSYEMVFHTQNSTYVLEIINESEISETAR